MLVATPSTPNSDRAVSALRIAARHEDPCTATITLASSESYCGLTTSPGRP